MSSHSTCLMAGSQSAWQHFNERLPQFRAQGQSDNKFRTLPLDCSSTNDAMMPFNDLLADGKAKPRPVKLLPGMQPLKNIKDLFLIFFLKPDAVILYGNGHVGIGVIPLRHQGASNPDFRDTIGMMIF